MTCVSGRLFAGGALGVAAWRLGGREGEPPGGGDGDRDSRDHADKQVSATTHGKTFLSRNEGMCDTGADYPGSIIVRDGERCNEFVKGPVAHGGRDLGRRGGRRRGGRAAGGHHAAECGRRVLLLEKNRKPGVKILMSGGTRCNLTHATDNRGIVAAYGPPGRFLHSALAAFGVQDTIDFFEAEGVATKVEETGKIFPVSNKALDVLDALLRRLRPQRRDAGPGRALRDLRAVRRPASP